MIGINERIRHGMAVNKVLEWYISINKSYVYSAHRDQVLADIKYVYELLIESETNCLGVPDNMIDDARHAAADRDMNVVV